jgi:metallo-beta-lactamase class B
MRDHPILRSYRALIALSFVSLGARPARAQGVPPNWVRSEWIEPFAPFRIVGNIYYVGSRGLASYLITSPQGHILLDTGIEQIGPQILANIATLGFDARDVKIMLQGHAHFDHAAADSLVKARTGAQLVVSGADARVLESGGKADFRFGDSISFPPVKVDRRMRDGERITLGGNTLTAHLTPGHTMGNTTWTMRATEAGQSYDVAFVGSMSINPGVYLAGYAPYPNIATDYARSLSFLATLHPDIFLGPHGSFFHLEEKANRQREGGTPNPFIDPQGYRDLLAEWNRTYQAQLARDRAARP